MAAMQPMTLLAAGTVSLSVTTVTGRVALGGISATTSQGVKQLRQYTVTSLPSSADIAYVRFGGSTVEAVATTGHPILPGSQVTFSQADDYIAAICPTSTATLRITAGDGEGPNLGAASVVTLAAGTGVAGVKDNGPYWTTAFGVSGVVFTSADATTAAAVTDAPTAGQKLVITDLIVSSDTAMFMIFEVETSGTDLLKVWVPANGTVQITPRSKLKLPTADKKLMVDASVAGNIAVTAFYYSEA